MVVVVVGELLVVVVGGLVVVFGVVVGVMGDG
jgi:hypothetical protein